jgi:predicted amidohydrolase YtcJ
MKKLFLCALALSLGATNSAFLFADTTVYMNVNGYTLNANRELQQFSAIQFTDDKVDRIFAQGEELPEQADLLIDGDGQTLIPGLIDAHGHVLSYGLSLLRVDLVGTQTEQEAVLRVVDFAQNSEQLEWIQGRGCNQVLWESN